MPSRSSPAEFSGAACIDSASYGFVHGTSPAVAEIVVHGRPAVAVGQAHSIQVDQSFFYGFVTNIQYDYEQYSTTIRMVDWRDRLRDVNIFAAWNISDDSGLWYHIEQDDWATQEQRWVNVRWLEAVNLNQLLAQPNAELNDEVIFDNDGFRTSWWILHWLCNEWNIELVADEVVLDRLKTTIPDNVDANQGMDLLSVIDYVVNKSGCQFSCYGENFLLITMRGRPMAGMGELIQQSIEDPCSTGAHKMQVGTELNERGRRVRLIGDRNQYEFIFPCVPDWNRNWSWDFTFGGPQFNALLSGAALLPQDEVKKLPVQYHDQCYWPLDSFQERQVGNFLSHRTRNEMTIEEYRSKVPFKVYRVCSNFIARDLEQVIDWDRLFEQNGQLHAGKLYAFDPDAMNLAAPYITDDDGTVINWAQVTADFDFPNLLKSAHEIASTTRDLAAPNGAEPSPDPFRYKFRYPLSRSLVTNTFKQFTAYATSHDIPEGWAYAFNRQRHIVPLESGVSLQVEETAPDAQNKRGYIIRLVFSDPQYILNEALFANDPNSSQLFERDRIYVRLSFDREIYEYLKGELGINLRVREKKVSTRNLYKGRVDGKLQPTVRQMKNWNNQPRDAIAKTDDVAEGIAAKLLSNQPITASGSMEFQERAGFIPDGLIDTVSVRFTDQDGITEHVNFTSSSNAEESFIGPSRVRVQDTERLHNEIIRDRLMQNARLAMELKSGIAQASNIAENFLRNSGGWAGDVMADKLFGKEGVVNAAIPVQVLTDEALVNPRAVLPANGNL